LFFAPWPLQGDRKNILKQNGIQLWPLILFCHIIQFYFIRYYLHLSFLVLFFGIFVYFIHFMHYIFNLEKQRLPTGAGIGL